LDEHEFGMRVVPPDHVLLENEAGDFRRGMSHLDPDKWLGVAVSSGLPPRERLVIVLHELTHCIDWVYEIDEDERVIDEESIAEKHGKAWTQLYLDNPRIVKWLVYTVDKIRKDQKAHTDAEAAEPETLDRDSGRASEAEGIPRPHEAGGQVHRGEEA
jgi:hypothetical protein